MKKLLILITLIGFAVAGYSQSIEDHGVFVRFNYANGDTIDLVKDAQAIYTDDNGNRVYVKTSGYNMKSLDYDALGYSSARDLQDYLSALFFGKYYETYVNVVGSTNLDSVKYWYISDTDTTLQYVVDWDWDADTISSKTIIPQ